MQVDNQHLKRQSTSLAPWEIQINTTIDKNKKAETTEGGYTGSWSTAEASGSWHCLVKLNIHIPYEPVVPLLGT